MSNADAVFTVLNADAPLLAVLTGGVKSYKDMPPDGVINRDTMPDVYDGTTQLPNPFAVVKSRALIPTSALRDPAVQYSSNNQAIEVWLYADVNAGWADLETAAGIVYGLLHDRPIEGMFNLVLTNELYEQRDMENNGMCFMRLDYLVTGYRSSES